MTQDMIITVETLHCKRDDQRNQGSDPYVWPAMMPIEQPTGIIEVSKALSGRAGVVIKNSQPGGTGGDPTQPGLPPDFATETRQYWFLYKG